MNEIDRRTEKLTSALRDAGVRITRQRAALLSVLAEAEDHPEAIELQRRAEGVVPGISLSTVYRTLTELESQGVILRHQFAGTPARFEHTETTHHDHMIDVDTGEVVEFANDRIERLQAEIAEAMGYEIVHHRLELYVRRKSSTRTAE
ncbi:transcriptional repressor [Sinirhodobacter sp. WL0062]|uniref:Ferric uptake regulation protein n=1 Tax=Rhodobacter flavimaris TaxID=2907145 RepID=A0ABS8YTD5_9RHOB|nr:Fur family transcriptional regulator [Sinirhodobacter sp. WL0062]MCE5973126.1 transcriptional repressor [Sinirhodobacter sp. WL0062]